METEVTSEPTGATEVILPSMPAQSADLSAILAQLQEQSKLLAQQAEMIDELKGNK